MAPDAEVVAALLPGEPPSPIQVPSGCAFHPRCAHAMAVCRAEPSPSPRRVGALEVSCHLVSPAELDS